MQEKIPDRVIDEAAEIEVVDLAPPELLQRLREGKVYIPDMAARAIEQFFNEGNLYALRELALRRAAERVDTQMIEYMRTRLFPVRGRSENTCWSVSDGPSGRTADTDGPPAGRPDQCTLVRRLR